MAAKRPARWILWLAVAAGLWLAWGVWFHGRLVKDTRLHVQHRDEAQQTLDAIQASLDAVPRLVARTDSTRAVVAARLAIYASADSLDQLMDRVAVRGRHYGLGSARLEPVLESLLSVRAATQVQAEADVKLDTLLVDATASGDFVRLGHWLDELEERADFQYWVSCHWSEADHDDLVRFAGRLALIVRAGNRSPIALGPHNGDE
jgi:hypothetical protein